MKHITDLHIENPVRETLADYKLIVWDDLNQTADNLAAGAYSDVDFATCYKNSLKAVFDMLSQCDTMVADAKEFGDKYMLGDCASDKFMLARIAKLAEEVSELSTAVAASDEHEIADALVDIVYVALVTAAKRGHPFRQLWQAVHASNMTKTPKGNGKFGASKGETFVPADLMGIMTDHGF